MNDMSVNPRATIGGNNPPIDAQMESKYAEDLRRYEELLKTDATAITEIADDETQASVAELIKALRAMELRFKHVAEDEKAPYETIVSNIRGFFKTRMEKLEKIRLPLKKLSEDYLAAKKAAEQKRLAEEEEKRRQAAAEKLRLATEAEQTSKDAQAAAEQARQLAEDAIAARAAATTEVEIATADLAQAKAAHQRLRADIAEVNAEFAQRAKDGNPVPAEERAAKSEEFKAKLAESKAKVEACEAILRQARETAAAAKRKAEEEERKRLEEERKARTAAREQKSHEDDAQRQEREANKIASKISGPAADLSRTRSEHGAVASLGSRWVCRVQDRTLVDKEALWPFIHEDAIQAAAQKWMNNQPDDVERRKMPGVYMAREDAANFR